jgi:hypothetical protein
MRVVTTTSEEISYSDLPTLPSRARLRKVWYGTTAGAATVKEPLWSCSWNGRQVSTHALAFPRDSRLTHGERDTTLRSTLDIPPRPADAAVPSLLDVKLAISSEQVLRAPTGLCSTRKEAELLPLEFIERYPARLSKRVRTRVVGGCVEISFTRVTRYATAPDGAVDPAHASDARAAAVEYHVEIEPLLPDPWPGRTDVAAWGLVLQELAYWWFYLQYAPA